LHGNSGLLIQDKTAMNTYLCVIDWGERTINLREIQGSGAMSQNLGTAQGTQRKPVESLELLDDPPLWSPWNFQSKQPDWHKIIYDEMRHSYAKAENT
jgi:hypothetical protein